ncbi:MULTISPECIES: hypothetical protein [unclassified Lysobacter]|uniref:hypothetical protein n=1 Tax=unclassified Lysobacter TaxID=2635362 RepID=UPI001C21FB9F|nr:hypothetical protein [Lysobacter sp. MMG2]MBU8976317.1 hypothetical protein [Lysobacter sp. MMG2]
MTRRIAPVLIALLVSACASAPKVALPVEARLHPGQRMALPENARITYIGTVNDSRCPPDVTCVHAGDADVRLRFQKPDTVLDVVLKASELGQPRAIGAWRVTLLALSPGPRPAATLRVNDAAR